MSHGLRRKLLLGAAAALVGLPLGVAAAIEGPTMFAAAGGVQDPVMCNITGTASFSPPLTNAGTNTGKGSTENVTLSGFTESHCLSSDNSGAPSSGSIPPQTIHIAATKSGSGKSAQYLTGYCPGFASPSSLKALKNLTFVSNWSGGAGGSTTITTKAAGIAGPNNLGEAGFAVPAKFGTGSYAAKVAQVVVFLTAAETAALGSQCASGPVSSVTFDSSTSTIVQ
jgi:hypothetical protein